MVVQFRGSMAGLHVLLSTLHPHPYERGYMTRSQCGSLLLHCMKLSFTTPCRLLPAHLNGLNDLNGELSALQQAGKVTHRTVIENLVDACETEHLATPSELIRRES